MKKKNRLLYQVAREVVALSGTVELIIGTYIGFLFGVGETSRAWLFTGLLAWIAYISTRLWIWCIEELTKNEHGNTEKHNRI